LANDGLSDDQIARRRESRRAWYYRNRESELKKIAEKRANGQLANDYLKRQTKIQEAAKKRYRNLDADGKKKYIQKVGEYRKNNRDLCNLWKSARRAREASGVGSVPANIVSVLMNLQRCSCAACKVDISKIEYHIDHIVPLSKGGLHDKSNLQLLCKKCNLTKSAKHPIDFMQSLGYLL
jgi:5-methylcytosine-specific restriction endonuclease McrA